MKYKRLLGAGIAGLAILLGASLAFTQVVPNFPARVNQTTQISYYRLVVSGTDQGFLQGNRSQKFGRLSKDTMITRYTVSINTAFNAGTNNNIWIGAINAINGLNVNAPISAANYVLVAPTDGKGAANADQSGWSAGTVGRASIGTAANFGTRLTSGGDVDLWVNYSGTGTTATAGAAIFIIEFVPDVN